MKIAIISDIHGNKLAFDAVLKSIKENECTKIFCLGDIAMAGYDPNYTIEKCMELQSLMGRNFEIIQGNTDKFIANYSTEKSSSLAENFTNALNTIFKTKLKGALDGTNGQLDVSGGTQLSRSMTLSDTVVAQVVQVHPNGNLLVQGKKSLVNQNERLD